MEKMDYYVNNNYVKKISFQADDIEIATYGEREKYLKYKTGELEDVDADLELKFDILYLLEEMGFSINRLGTYFYKDIIFKIIKRLEWLDTDGYEFLVTQIEKEKIKERKVTLKEVLNKYKVSLLEELGTPYSQFYFDIARNDNSIGTKTFHSYIQKSFERLDDKREKYYLLVSLANNNGNRLKYGHLAFNIASYIRKNGFNKEDVLFDEACDIKLKQKVKK